MKVLCGRYGKPHKKISVVKKKNLHHVRRKIYNVLQRKKYQLLKINVMSVEEYCGGIVMFLHG